MNEARTCIKCEKPAIFHRRYSGESLCSNHFKESILEKTKRTIAKYGLLGYGDRIAVGVSGGKDSTSLLKILSGICQEHHSEIHAITVDEGIPGYRDESLEYVHTVTEKLGVPLVVLSYQELYGFTLEEALANRQMKISSCAMCGPLRRRALDIGAKKVNANVVATAHNLDDVLQTFYINLLSGDVDRIRWLTPSQKSKSDFATRRIKPFMEIYEDEIVLYAYLSDIPFQSIACPHSHEGIRSEIRAWLNLMESKHPGIKYSAFKTVLAIADGLNLRKGKVVQTCRNCGMPSTSPLCNVCQTIQIVTPNR